MALVPVPEAPEVCLAEAEELLSARDRITSALAARVGRVHRAGEAKSHGHASTKLWLRSAGGMTPAGAGRLLTMGMELVRLHEVRRLFAEGSLPEGIVEAICTATSGLTDDQAKTAEGILLELARSAGAAEVAKAGRYLRAVLDPDGHEKDEQADFDRRFFRVRRRRNGAVEGEFYLPVEAAARLQHWLDVYAKPKAEGDDRTLSVRNADALIAFLENRIATELLVLVNAESLPADPPDIDSTSTDSEDCPGDRRAHGRPGGDRPGERRAPGRPGRDRSGGGCPTRDSEEGDYPHASASAETQGGTTGAGTDAPWGTDPDAPPVAEHGGSAWPGAGADVPPQADTDAWPRAERTAPLDGEGDGPPDGGCCSPREAGAETPRWAGGSAWPGGGARLGGEAWAGVGVDASPGAEDGGSSWGGSAGARSGVGVNSPPGVWLRGLPGLILATGQLLPVSSVHRLARTSTLVRIVMDAAGQVLDMGRKVRLATPAQRRAIFTRYATCWVDGCPLPATMCQIDHADDWCSGGLTDLKLLGPACQFHNRDRYRHPTRYTRRKIADDRWAFTYRNPNSTRLRV
uniref:HNH endonuclease signature motif containing protein n=1 Tax=Microbispora cellulosiformans TaxID=2614688 RepID=UPI001786F707|nr:HNH endonuclease signature motif containing protein [Microbispora cellulosiformans]